MDNIEINRIKTEYAKKITDNIMKHKELIIESFVEFYGEDHKTIITTRFNDISFLYYINDFTIFYIVDSLKEQYSDKFKNVIFAIPYITHLLKNNLYKQKVTPQNFYELGINKIVGASNNDLLKDKELLKYSIALALRDDNQNPYEFNLPVNEDIKRIIAIPVFSIDDKSLFHEINHAICSEIINKNGEIIVKSGLECSNEEEEFCNEIINDIISLEIYNIFKQKCKENILDDNVMQDALFEVYADYHSVVTEFYEKNKDRVKRTVIDSRQPQLEKQKLEYLTKLIQQSKKNK